MSLAESEEFLFSLEPYRMLLPQFAFAQKLYMGDPLITAPGTYYGPYKYHALALQPSMFVTKLNSGTPPPNEVIYPDFDSFCEILSQHTRCSWLTHGCSCRSSSQQRAEASSGLCLLPRILRRTQSGHARREEHSPPCSGCSLFVTHFL